MNRILLTFSLLVIGQSIYSQTKIDSIWTIWQDETKSNTIRLRTMDGYLISNYYRLPSDSLSLLSELQYQFAKDKNMKKFMANGLFFQALSQQFKGNSAKAMTYHIMCLKIYEELDDKQGISATFSSIGGIYIDQGMISKGMDNYKRALKIDEAIGNKSGLSFYYSTLGSVYFRLGDCSKAMEYYQKSWKIDEELNDKMATATSLTNVGVAYSCQKKYTKALDYFLRSLKIQEELGDIEGISTSLNNIGDSYQSMNEHSKALDYYQQALKVQEKMGENKLTSQLLTNIGKLNTDKGDYKNAIHKCEKSLKIAQKIDDIVAQKSACNCLYIAYKTSGKSMKALEYYERTEALNDSLKSQNNIKNMQNLEFAKQLEIDSIAQVVKDTKVEMAHQTEVRKKEKNRNIAIATSIFFLLISGGLYSRWRYTKKSKAVIEKEKDRSDILLLNILPVEIAEELKAKGSADARDFEMVSILFSDFKGFTGLSEKMSAKDLVANINICFKAFDHIMQKFNIEKIKTIGDAYMAAGGLPVNSDHSVKNTVLAALEMQDFITKLHKEKETKGEHAFEMRVGIHTGPVVAGIVGIKKFQYDIWGDTVNTASRMESNGEVGKVNISENTYELIKNDSEFEFVSRGKIEVKGKGAIQMYFASKNEFNNVSRY